MLAPVKRDPRRWWVWGYSGGASLQDRESEGLIDSAVALLPSKQVGGELGSQLVAAVLQRPRWLCTCPVSNQTANEGEDDAVEERRRS